MTDHITPEQLVERWGPPPAPWMPAHMAALLNAYFDEPTTTTTDRTDS